MCRYLKAPGLKRRRRRKKKRKIKGEENDESLDDLSREAAARKKGIKDLKCPSCGFRWGDGEVPHFWVSTSFGMLWVNCCHANVKKCTRLKKWS